MTGNLAGVECGRPWWAGRGGCCLLLGASSRGRGHGGGQPAGPCTRLGLGLELWILYPGAGLSQAAESGGGSIGLGILTDVDPGVILEPGLGYSPLAGDRLHRRQQHSSLQQPAHVHRQPMIRPALLSSTPFVNLNCPEVIITQAPLSGIQEPQFRPRRFGSQSKQCPTREPKSGAFTAKVDSLVCIAYREFQTGVGGRKLNLCKAHLD